MLCRFGSKTNKNMFIFLSLSHTHRQKQQHTVLFFTTSIRVDTHIFTILIQMFETFYNLTFSHSHLWSRLHLIKAQNKMQNSFSKRQYFTTDFACVCQIVCICIWFQFEEVESSHGNRSYPSTKKMCQAYWRCVCYNVLSHQITLDVNVKLL